VNVLNQQLYDVSYIQLQALIHFLAKCCSVCELYYTDGTLLGPTMLMFHLVELIHS